MENNRDETPSSDAGGGGGGGGGGSHPPNPNPNPNSPRTTRGKSCSGWTYYSSVLKVKSKNPRCIGFSKSIPHVPAYGKGATESRASKADRKIIGFKYSCIGYSVYLDNKDSPAGSQDKTARLPGCTGLELGINYFDPDADHVPAHAHKSEERDNATPQPQKKNKPPNVLAGFKEMPD